MQEARSKGNAIVEQHKKALTHVFEQHKAEALIQADTRIKAEKTSVKQQLGMANSKAALELKRELGAVHHGVYARPSVRSDTEGIEQIARGIRTVGAHRQHGAGEDERTVKIRQQTGEQRGGIRKRIRAVRQNKAVVVCAVVPDRARHVQTILGGDIGRVKLHQIERIDLAQSGERGKRIQKRGTVQCGGQPGGRFAAGDGAAGGKHEDMFSHGETS